jgi:predicted acetyltransferase
MTQDTSIVVDGARDDEVAPLSEVLSAALHLDDAPYMEQWLRRVGVGHVRVVRVAGLLAGGMTAVPAAQYFGGRAVPCAGVSAVAIAPELRGRGASLALMHTHLVELRAGGTPLSVLYPATHALYARLGYGVAGVRVLWEVPASALPSGDRTLDVVAVPSGPDTRVESLYRRCAAAANGPIVRTAVHWWRLHEPYRARASCYLFGGLSGAQAYVFYVRGLPREPITVLDHGATGAAAFRRVLTFFADQRTMMDRLQWWSGPVDALGQHLVEAVSCRPVQRQPWMLRIVDVAAALAARGYRAPVEAELHLQVHDDVLPENAGRYVLHVTPGGVEVTRGGRGDMALDVCALAALYSGEQHPAELAAAGRLAADVRAVDVAGMLFAGPRPWMNDKF